MMRRSLTALLVASTLSSLPLSAMGCFDRCGAFEGGGELLIMRASNCDQLYAILDPRTFAETGQTSLTGPPNYPQGAKKVVHSQYTPGFRVWLGYVVKNQCADISGGYSRLHTRHTSTAHPKNGGGLWPTLIAADIPVPVLYDPIGSVAGQLPAVGRARLRYDYDAADLELGARALLRCNLWARGFVGVHFAYIDRGFNVDYTGTALPGVIVAPFATSVIIRSSAHATTWGVGPEIGAQGIYTIGCGFGIGGRFVTGLLAGNAKDNLFGRVLTRNVGSTAPVTTEYVSVFHGKPRTHVTPFLGGRLGINYRCCCFFKTVLVGEFGYEFRSYLTTLKHQDVFRQATGAEIFEGFNLDGFYFSLMVQI